RWPGLRARHLAQPPKMSWGLPDLGSEERLHEIPGHARSHGAATDADDVHVIVFDSLCCRKMVMDQSGAHPRDLVRTDRGPHAAAADGDTALERCRRHRLGERDDEIRVVVVRAQRVSAKIDDVVSCRAKPRHEIFLQRKPAVIGRDAYPHRVISAMSRQCRDGTRPSAAAAAWSASTTAVC